MSLKIGLISDVHATSSPLRQALSVFRKEKVESILCAGDIAGYGTELEPTIELLKKYRCRVILGNHDLWWLWRTEEMFGGPVADYLRSLPVTDTITVLEKKILMVHGSPPESIMDGIQLLSESGDVMQSHKDYWTDALRKTDCDVLLVGHTHQVFAQWLGRILVINPGSTLFNHTCAILTLPDMDVQFVTLGNKAPVLSWHWGCSGESV